MVELAGIAPGDVVLDVAGGYGEPSVTAAQVVGPRGRVICTEGLGAFACSEFLPSGRVFHWLSPVDLSGQWPDFP